MHDCSKVYVYKCYNGSVLFIIVLFNHWFPCGYIQCSSWNRENNTGVQGQMHYLLTLQVTRYCLFALQIRIDAGLLCV